MCYRLAGKDSEFEAQIWRARSTPWEPLIPVLRSRVPPREHVAITVAPSGWTLKVPVWTGTVNERREGDWSGIVLGCTLEGDTSRSPGRWDKGIDENRYEI